MSPAAPSEQVTYTIAANVKPGPVAYDFRRNALWTFDANRNKPIPVFSGRDPGRRGGSLVPGDAVDYDELPHRPEIRGIAFYRVPHPRQDREILGLCRGGGLCSTIEIYDLRDMRLITRFFPRCEPVDIAVDPDGRRFWILADNGPDRGMVLFERHVTRALTENGYPHPSVLETRRFRVLPTDIRGAAIAATGEAVWVLSEHGDEGTGTDPQLPAVHQLFVGSMRGSSPPVVP
jgi:hypothetical protein